MDVIHECNEAWEKLITGSTPAGGISTYVPYQPPFCDLMTDPVNSSNITVAHSPSRVSPEQLPPVPANENLPPAPIDASIDKWFFISGASA